MSRPTLALAAAATLTLTGTLTASVAATAGPWTPPVRPVRIVEGFDPPAHNWLAGHRGIDLRAEPDQTVRAAGAGRVTFAGMLAGRGVVVVDHGPVRTTYEPVDADVAVGERVAAGEPIGVIALGTGHCGDGACLHLGLRRGTVYLDPRLALGAGHPRLVPW